MYLCVLSGMRRITVEEARRLMRHPHIGGVYALVDPQEPGRVRYVGSSRHMAKRLLDHAFGVGGAREAHRKEWVRSLKKQGRAPELVVLELISAAKESFEIHYAEHGWVERFRLIGMADLNRTLTTDERDFLLGQISRLRAENARLRKLVMQHATLRATLQPSECCEEPKTAM